MLPLEHTWHRLRGSLPETLHENTPWQEQEYLVLDMETTGLNASKDKAISLGWVLIQNGAIKLHSARHILLDNGPIDGKSVEIHLITDDDINEYGRSPEAALRYLRQLLSDKMLIAHNASIEVNFLKRLWAGHGLKPLSVAVLDTLAMERISKERAQETLKTDAFRLPACRARYSLPDYDSHNALSDALATAELFLAQAHHAKGVLCTEDMMQMAGQVVSLR